MTHIKKTRVRSQFDTMKSPVSTLKFKSRKPLGDVVNRAVNFVTNFLCKEGPFSQADRVQFG